MIEGYCVKCKAKRPIAAAVEELMKNGRKAVKGKCPTCGAVMFKILGGKAVPPPSAAVAAEASSPAATSAPPPPPPSVDAPPPASPPDATANPG